MTMKERVQRTPEEKWEIVQEGIRSGNIADTCRRYRIAPTLYYRWKDEAEQGAKAALGGKSAAAQPDLTKIWAGPAVGWGYLVSVIDCCTREIVGWNLSARCRTDEVLAAVEQAVLERLPAAT